MSQSFCVYPFNFSRLLRVWFNCSLLNSKFFLYPLWFHLLSCVGFDWSFSQSYSVWSSFHCKDFDPPVVSYVVWLLWRSCIFCGRCYVSCAFRSCPVILCVNPWPDRKAGGKGVGRYPGSIRLFILAGVVNIGSRLDRQALSLSWGWKENGLIIELLNKSK